MPELFKSMKLPEPTNMGSYEKEDVVFLLKDITHLISEQDTHEREELIQGGRHYSEMLPVEYTPTKEYIDLFYTSLKESARRIAEAVAIVTELIILQRGLDFVLVSLARAGTPIGVLIKRYMRFKYHVSVPHYSISIIRGKGLDENAMRYIIKHHPASQLQFVDGWTGKGAILKVLDDAISDFNREYHLTLDSELAVLADPAGICSIYGTRDDFLISSACLNSTVSGLISRTVHSNQLIGNHDFHGAKFYKELISVDVSRYFIETICAEYPQILTVLLEKVNTIYNSPNKKPALGIHDVSNILRDFSIEDINLIKPGVGETTRVLLRRVPWKILVSNVYSPHLRHILLLAKDRGVPVETYPLQSYDCCGIIKPLERK